MKDAEAPPPPQQQQQQQQPQQQQQQQQATEMVSAPTTWTFMAFAVLFGCVASGSLKWTRGFTRLVPSLVCATSIVLYIMFLSKVMTRLPIGVTYATYSAIAIANTTLVGFCIYSQTPSCYTMVGLALVVSGVFVLHTPPNAGD
jgi:multidrug transporter EmrE-like cation transporter